MLTRCAIGQRVDSLEEQDVLPTVRRLADRVEDHYLELGGVLLKVLQKGWYEEGGRKNFKHRLAANTGVQSSMGYLQLEHVLGVTVGCGYRIRAFTVFRREQDRLL